MLSRTQFVLSLVVTPMTTGMMLPIAQRLDDAGFEGIELISGSHLKKTVRELREDPWERVRLVSKLITKTPLRLIAGRVNTFEYNPPSMYRLFVERMFANGIREARISDEWNDYEGWKFRVGECHRAGLKSILNLDLFGFAQAFGRIFRRADATGRFTQSVSALPKGSRRAADSGAHGNSGADHLQECQWNSGRAAHPLHDGLRTALLHQRNGARHSLDQHGTAAVGRRLFESVVVQRRQERPRSWLCDGHR